MIVSEKEITLVPLNRLLDAVMPTFFRLLILVILFCLISCSPKSEAGPKTITISDADLINIPLENILSRADFTPLEFTPESALSEDAMFLNCTSTYYLMDQFRKKVVYQFDPSGRFVRTIGKQGKGPGEYPYFSDAKITSSGLEFLSGSPHTDVYKYSPDGRFIRTDRMLGQYSQSFAVNPESGNYYFICPWYQHLIQVVDDKSLQPVDSFLVRNSKISLAGLNPFSSTGLGFMLFYQLFDNRIFGIDTDTIDKPLRAKTNC